MKVDKACWERGCACHDDRVDGETIEVVAKFEQEPVAWISAAELVIMRGNALGGAKDWRVNLGLKPEEGDVGLYTTPPQRTWVGLTDEERKDTLQSVNTGFVVDASVVAIAIEAKLKEKNG